MGRVFYGFTTILRGSSFFYRPGWERVVRGLGAFGVG